MLSAKSEDTDKILGLNMGADDYVTKPFNPLELVARAKSQLRKVHQTGNIQETDNVYRTGGLAINDERKEVAVDDEPVKLTPIEYNIPLLLMKNQGRVFSIEQIYENIWQERGNRRRTIRWRSISAISVKKIEINPKEPRYPKVVGCRFTK